MLHCARVIRKDTQNLRWKCFESSNIHSQASEVDNANLSPVSIEPYIHMAGGSMYVPDTN